MRFYSDTKPACEGASHSNGLIQACVTMRDIDIRAPSGDRCRNDERDSSDEKSNNEFVVSSQQINRSRPRCAFNISLLHSADRLQSGHLQTSNDVIRGLHYTLKGISLLVSRSIQSDGRPRNFACNATGKSSESISFIAQSEQFAQ